MPITFNIIKLDIKIKLQIQENIQDGFIDMRIYGMPAPPVTKTVTGSFSYSRTSTCIL